MSPREPRRPLELVPRYEEHGYDPQQVADRRRWVEEKTGATLEHVGRLSMPSESMRGNIENPIGAVQIPLAALGPLVVAGEHAQGTFYVPFATTEGALVRSYERGMAALAHAGGVEVRLLRNENLVSPAFRFSSVAAATSFLTWLEESTAEIRRIAESTTRHGRLLRLICRSIGREVAVEFHYSTADASGMNMMVRATEQACRWIVERSGADGFSIFSGAESEKRASASLWSGGKGKWLLAGARLPAWVLKSMLRTEAATLARFATSSLAAHVTSGTVAHNAQLANGLAAIFLACGQDVANIANSATGITRFEDCGDGTAYASLTLPSLTVGTVGGGTALATSRECLEMIGCFGAGKAAKLAEIVAATLLAGELSMTAAIVSGEFAAAHEALGRNRPPDPSADAG